MVATRRVPVGFFDSGKAADLYNPGLALARLLRVDANCEIEVDAFVGDKAVLEVAGKARVAGGVSTGTAPRSRACVLVDLTTSSATQPR